MVDLAAAAGGGGLGSAFVVSCGVSVIFWSKNTFSDESKKDEKLKGLNFSRVMYPKDSRMECWFCLASPTCEKHLLVSIGETAYVTMPKGALIDTHSLIVPVGCDGKGALIGKGAKEVAKAVEPHTTVVQEKQQDFVILVRYFTYFLNRGPS